MKFSRISTGLQRICGTYHRLLQFFYNFLVFLMVFQEFLGFSNAFLDLQGLSSVAMVCLAVIAMVCLALVWFPRYQGQITPFGLYLMSPRIRYSMSHLPFQTSLSLPFLGPAAPEANFIEYRDLAVFRCFHCNNTFGEYCNTGLFRVIMLQALSRIYYGFQRLSAFFMNLLPFLMCS